MKAAFGVEVIGQTASMDILAKTTGYNVYRGVRPWVAELTGLDGRYGFARQFLRAKRDYRNSNSKGTRGVWWWWTLESGRVYETRYHTSWKHQEHRFLTVTDDGDIKDLTEEEVQAWLRNGCSESMS